MTLLIAAALAASPATTTVPAPAGAPVVQAQPAQPGAKAKAEGCACCKKMAEGGKMACRAEHGEGHGGEHAGHDARS